MSTETTETPTRDRSMAIDMVVVAVLAVAVRVVPFFAARHLSFDDGTFAASALAMRDGALPFRDVFSSQGPLFLPLVWIGDLLGARTMNGPRVLAVVSGVVIAVTVYWIGRRVADRAGAWLGAGVALTSGCLMWVTAPLAADGPALAFATLAVAAAVAQRDRPRHLVAVLTGLAVGACLSTKAMEAPVLWPVALVLIAPLWSALRSRSRDAILPALIAPALAATSAVVVFVVVSLPFGFADVWDQSFVYRTEAATSPAPLANAGKILSTLWDRDLVLWWFAAVCLIAALVLRPDRPAARRRPDDSSWQPSDRLLLAGWLVVTFVWLSAVVSPLWRPHVAAMIPPAALVLAMYRPPMRVLAPAAVVAVVLVPIQLDKLWFIAPDPGDDAEIMAELAALPADAWVLSDEPGLVWRAGLRTNDDLVDPSMLRVQQGRYTSDSLVEDAADPRVCAVVIVSDDRFGAFEDLPERLGDEGFEWRVELGDGHGVLVDPGCEALAGP